MPPVKAAARRITPTSPSTTQPTPAAPRNSFAMISGPMPQASPIVRATSRRGGACGSGVIPALSRFAPRAARRHAHRR